MTFRLTKHIEQLLALHSSVTVPGLGSFLVELQPAYFDAAECLIYPTCSELYFNELLQHQDGLLAQSYAEAYAISHRRARLMIEGDVRSLRNSLVHRRRITLGTLGALSLSEGGRIVFEPQSVQSFHGTAYGLSPIALPKQRRETQGEAAADPNYLHFRLSKRSLSWGAAAAVLLLALMPWGKGVEREPLYRASVAPTELSIESILPSETPQPAKQTETLPEGWLSPVAGMHYIIIATEKTPERAQVHYTEALKWLPEGEQAGQGILLDKKVYRVSAAQFAEARDAYTYVKELGKLGREAWVYRAK